MSGKFRDKETGAEGYLRASREMEYQIEDERGMPINGSFKTLSELLEKWEEIKEEPKGKALRWMILTLENFIENEPDDRWIDLEDCKQMLEKLKAWERLKDKGFRFVSWTRISDGSKANLEITAKVDDYVTYDDLDLLFGGEE